MLLLRIGVDAITKPLKHLIANVAKDLIVWLLGWLTKITSRLEEEDVILAEDLTRETLGTLIESITKQMLYHQEDKHAHGLNEFSEFSFFF